LSAGDHLAPVGWGDLGKPKDGRREDAELSGLLAHPYLGSPGDEAGVCRFGIRWICAFLIVLLPLYLPPATQAGEGKELLAELKVAYIYNFTRFIRWPEAPASRPFIIGVIGDPVIEEALRVLEKDGKRVDDRRIEIHGYTSGDGLGPCDVLFVGADAEGQLDTILRQTAGKPTLLVGDTRGYAGRGVAIELFRKPDVFRKSERLRFRINRSALIAHGLKVSAQLYYVAEIVE